MTTRREQNCQFAVERLVTSEDGDLWILHSYESSRRVARRAARACFEMYGVTRARIIGNPCNENKTRGVIETIYP